MKSVAATVALSFALVFGSATAAAGQQQEILVSAAASLTDVLSGLAPQAEKSIGAKVLFNFGGSGALRKQIEDGAPVDVFFSASVEDMATLQAKGLVVAGTREDLLSNQVVLIGGPAAEPLHGATAAAARDDLQALLEKTDLLAIGNPDTVPAGRYAVQALKRYGVYATVASRLALAGNVREVLQYVQNGSAPLGIVFATDALAAPAGSVKQLFVFPQGSLETPILYPVAVVSASKNKEKAARMIEFLKGDPARNAFRAAGFILK